MGKEFATVNMYKNMLLVCGVALLAALLEGCGGGGGGGGIGLPTTTGIPTTTTTTTTAPEYGAQVKVVNYNLFWWCVSGNPDNAPEVHNEHCKEKNGGGKGFAALYARIKENLPFDFIGFSEVIDVQQVLRGVGLQDSFDSYVAPPQQWNVRDSGFAWSKSKFDKLSEPNADLMSTDIYGKRWLGYVRLQVKETKQTVLFANTHGGLGHCGGPGGQEVYSNFMKSIAKNRKEGDSVIVTGDFNCLPNEEVMELIMENFTTFHDKTMKYDNIVRSNWVRLDDSSSVNAPPSDHSIITATMSLPNWEAGKVVPDPPPSPSPGPKPPMPGKKSQCADIKCGNHDDSCWCTPSCVSHNSCCPDYKQVCAKTDTELMAVV